MTGDEHGTGSDCCRAAREAAAYVDGDMDETLRAAFEDRLADDPELQFYVDAYRSQDVRMREAMAPLLQAPVPDTLLQVMERGSGRRPAGALRAIAASAALIVVGAAAGWGGATYLQDRSVTPMHAVLDTLRHDDTLASILTAPGNGGTMPITQGVRSAVPTERLEASGFTEIERSVQTVAGQAALIIDYRTPAGKLVTLMVQRQTAPAIDRPARLVREDGVSASIWTGGTTVYTLISPTSDGLDMGALTARLRGEDSLNATQFPGPLSPDPEKPLAGDVPDDHMATGPGDLQLAPGVGQKPEDVIPEAPAVQAPQGAPGAQSL